MYPDVAECILTYHHIVLSLIVLGSEGSPTLKYIYQVELPDSYVGLRQSIKICVGTKGLLKIISCYFGPF